MHILTAAERIEIATYMIGLWADWADMSHRVQIDPKLAPHLPPWRQS